MRDLEFIGEADLDYWRRQAKEGKAILLDFPEEALLNLSLADLFQDEKSTELSEEKIAEILNANQTEIEGFEEKMAAIRGENERLREEMTTPEETAPEPEKDPESVKKGLIGRLGFGKGNRSEEEDRKAFAKKHIPDNIKRKAKKAERARERELEGPDEDIYGGSENGSGDNERFGSSLNEDGALLGRRKEKEPDPEEYTPARPEREEPDIYQEDPDDLYAEPAGYSYEPDNEPDEDDRYRDRPQNHHSDMEDDVRRRYDRDSDREAKEREERHKEQMRRVRLEKANREKTRLSEKDFPDETPKQRESTPSSDHKDTDGSSRKTAFGKQPLTGASDNTKEKDMKLQLDRPMTTKQMKAELAHLINQEDFNADKARVIFEAISEGVALDRILAIARQYKTLDEETMREAMNVKLT